MRTPIAAGNWKMNLSPDQAVALARKLKETAPGIAGVNVVLCPPALYLPTVLAEVRGTPIAVGGQNHYWKEEGAFTGEVSARMLKQMGCQYGIVGHSERRQFFHETDGDVNLKVKAALKEGLTPILCVGETLQQRQAGQTPNVVRTQILQGLDGLSPAEVGRIVVAYEPVWAIGTGQNATPDQANEVHLLIRNLIREKSGAAIGDAIRILYGGSVKPENIRDLAAKPDIDGALVGGASLKADGFLDIIRGCAAKRT